MVNKLCLVMCVLMLSACSRFDLSDVATTAGATTAATAAAALGAPTLVIATSTLAGGVAGGALVEDETSAIDACLENPEICREVEFWDTIKDFIHWIIGGTVLLIIVAWLIPGPQTLWRKKDAGSNSTRHGPRRNRSYR